MQTSTRPRVERSAGDQAVVVSTWAAVGGALVGLLYVLMMPVFGVPVVLVVVAARALRGRKDLDSGEVLALPLPEISELFPTAAAAPLPVVVEPPPGPTALELAGPLVDRLGCEYVVVDANLCISHHLTPGVVEGSAAPSLVGRSCHEALHGSEAPCGACGGDCPADAAIAAGHPVRSEHVHLSGDGGERHVDVTALPVAHDDEGEVTHVALLISDRS